MPHGRAQLLLPRLRRRRGARAPCDGARGPARRVDEFRVAGARLHRRAGVARGARRSRDAAVGVREARRRPRGLPARVGRARRTVGPVLVPRPRSGAHVRRARPEHRVDRRRRRPTACPSDQGTLALLDALLARFRAPTLPELPPFHGGIVGWMGYDTVREIEHLPSPPPDDLGFPTRCARSPGRSPRSTTSVSGCTSSRTCTRRRAPTTTTLDAMYDGAIARLDNAVADLGRPLPYRPALPPGDELDELPEVRRNFAGGAWAEAVDAAKEHILDGDIFQVVLAQRFDLVEPVDSARRLPRAAARQPVAVHVLPAPPGGDGRRIVAGGVGAAARRPGHQPPDRGHAPARSQRTSTIAGSRPSSSSTRRNAPST